MPASPAPARRCSGAGPASLVTPRFSPAGLVGSTGRRQSILLTTALKLAEKLA